MPFPIPPPGSRPMTAADKEQLAALMARAGAAVNENGQMTSRLLNFVLTNELFHKVGSLALLLDPKIQSALAAHALVVIGLAEAKAELEQIVWDTYRTTLAHRLAEKRAAAMRDAENAFSPEGMPKLTEADMKLELPLVKGEIEIWEKVARQALDQKEGRAQKPSAPCLGENVAWEKSTIS